MSIPSIIAIVFAAGSLAGFGLLSIGSVLEKERRAALLGGLAAVGLPWLYLAAALFGYPHQGVVVWILLAGTAAGLLVLLLPTQGPPAGDKGTPTVQIDERDTMFSRRELDVNPARFAEYYRRHPEKLAADNKFRARPGLLGEKSKYYDPLLFASAQAGFRTVRSLDSVIDDSRDGVAPVRLEPAAVSVYLKRWAKKLGAVSAGITELKKYHLYSVLGRHNRYDRPPESGHRFALALTVEMNRDMMAMAPQGPTVMESAQQYLAGGVIAVQIADLIKTLGYSARAHIDGNYQVVCPLVARDAGLGEIGRMGLLMTPELGPRVRLAVVTTDMPLKADSAARQPAMIEFCRVCKKCAEACPPQAIPHGDRTEIDGVKRWRIGSEECYTFWCAIGTDCGRCIRVCPFSHPDNLFHRLVRRGVNRSAYFRKFALKMDHVFYGRQPPPAPVPAWMKVAEP